MDTEQIEPYYYIKIYTAQGYISWLFKLTN